MPAKAMEWARRRAPELALAALACAVFLGYLGSIDLWGKREQRASAEAIDTITKGNWLVAQIQGRQRLEKPPLPRWTIALLMELTGRRDEWIVRLPSALSALGMVGLVYALGCRLGGRQVGLASGLALTSFVFFISELRQAGNDGPLAFFVTLALYAAWRRLHADPVALGTAADGPPPALGSGGWTLLMYGALGLGFLTKGPVVLVIVALTIVPYLASAGRLREGLAGLASGRGLLLFLLLALSWPVPVLVSDPNAGQVWYLEMAQKAGSAGIKHHRARLLALDWPWMTAPWILLATTGLGLPFLRRGRSLRPTIWFPWWWTAGNLAMFCLWKVAKPNYFLPCMPGAALLIGIEWVRLTRVAREAGPVATRARRLLQAHWVALFVGALVAPVVVHQVAPGFEGWAAGLSALVVSGVILSAWAWRRGADAGALTPLVGALVVGVVIGCGAIAPRFNRVKSHRELAATLDRLLPHEARTVMFFHEIDEGLWFYLRDRDLKPVPGSQPEYNEAFSLYREFRENKLEWDVAKRQQNEKKVLLDWIKKSAGAQPYVLMRARDYDLFGPDLTAVCTPLYRERGLLRNELMLVRVAGPDRPIASDQATPTRR